MAQPSRSSATDLKGVYATLNNAASESSIEGLEAAIDTLLEASRDAGTRDEITAEGLQPSVFDLVLDLLVNPSKIPSETSSLELKLLRCAGNLLVDNNENREHLLFSGNALMFLRDAIVFETIGDQDKQYERAALALKVAFNLCNDYEPAQKAALSAHLDRAVLRHIHTCLFISKDETTDLGTEFLAMVAQHLKDTEATKNFDKDFVNQALRLPCVEDVDQDTFLEMATAIGPYLAYPQFEAAVLSTDQINLAFELLEKTIFMLSNSPKAEDGKLFESVLLRSITDISTLPDFPSTFPSSPQLVQKLCDRCVLTENDSDSANLAVCSCILLGNFATDPAAAASIISQIKMDGLYDFITLKAYRRSRTSTATGLQDHADYLHAAAGMLRHLALPPAIREKYFRDQPSKQTAMALAQYPRPEVQVAGLRLLRQFVIDDVAGLEHIIQSGYHTALLKLFSEPTTDDRVKLEISRTITGLLREAAKPPTQTSNSSSTSLQPTDLSHLSLAESLISSLLSAPDLLEPLAYAVTDSKLPLAQAEGYLGLCLVLRCSPSTGAALISSLLQSHPDLLASLRTQIVGTSTASSENSSSGPSATTKAIEAASQRKDEVANKESEVLPLQGAKTEAAATGIAGKARDNAVVLLSELLKNEGIDDGLRDSLDGIANEAGITLRL
ncbi:hypothetical protein C1H76_2313 [Elsinoe australis]|uniref:Uncharacterized protein n=1 Tax=Elsinoe australis TaxID=40998 RepID=A0A4U7B320_9PEZI|nr:hypothetical protein C1H76_2313 [Elsinoe australis]